MKARQQLLCNGHGQLLGHHSGDLGQAQLFYAMLCIGSLCALDPAGPGNGTLASQGAYILAPSQLQYGGADDRTSHAYFRRVRDNLSKCYQYRNRYVQRSFSRGNRGLSHHLHSVRIGVHTIAGSDVRRLNVDVIRRAEPGQLLHGSHRIE